MLKGLRLSSSSVPSIVWSAITVEEWTGKAEHSRGGHVAVSPSKVHVVQGRIRP
jgi:hypothetical protein